MVVAFEILRAHLLVGFTLPDVAHDTAAVTSVVSIKNENGQARELRWSRWL
jgi:hypothetical protein